MATYLFFFAHKIASNLHFLFAFIKTMIFWPKYRKGYQKCMLYVCYKKLQTICILFLYCLLTGPYRYWLLYVGWLTLASCGIHHTTVPVGNSLWSVSFFWCSHNYSITSCRSISVVNRNFFCHGIIKI